MKATMIVTIHTDKQHYTSPDHLRDCLNLILIEEFRFPHETATVTVNLVTTEIGKELITQIYDELDPDNEDMIDLSQ